MSRMRRSGESAGAEAPAHPLFPPGFRFGTSSAAYQIEGAPSADGKGPSIWDTFTATPGAVVDGSSGAMACDHFGRHREDVALMARLGVNAYRFSLSWPRLQPTGRGRPSPKGLAFYDRLIDELLEAGISPMVTLYHWDLPQSLEDDGGWLNKATIEAFADYAEIAGSRFGDRVEAWVPMNEPNVMALMGYCLGTHAPGHALLFDGLPITHHLLLAHGRACIALRGSVRGREATIGCANNHAPIWPASADEADVGAGKLFDAMWNGMLTEPMLLGRYPVDILPLVEDAIEDGDMSTIRQPLDFYGVNFYNPMRVAATEEDSEMPFEMRPVLGYPLTDNGWPVVPEALREWLVLTRARYRAALPPIVITESGCADGTTPDPDGVVDDQPRIDYLAAHVQAVSAAVARGVDVRGYYARSLLDCFEWADGYTQRFGLVHVDHDTQARTPKRSFDWYADLIAAQRPAEG